MHSVMHQKRDIFINENPRLCQSIYLWCQETLVSTTCIYINYVTDIYVRTLVDVQKYIYNVKVCKLTINNLVVKYTRCKLEESTSIRCNLQHYPWIKWWSTTDMKKYLNGKLYFIYFIFDICCQLFIF